MEGFQIVVRRERQMRLSSRKQQAELVVIVDIVDRHRHDTRDEAAHEGNDKIYHLCIPVHKRNSVAMAQIGLVPDQLRDLLRARSELLPCNRSSLLALRVQNPVCRLLPLCLAAMPEHSAHVIELRHGHIAVVRIVNGKGHISRLEWELMYRRRSRKIILAVQRRRNGGRGREGLAL